MSDLAARLRSFSETDDGASPFNADSELCLAAADEIERLSKTVEEMARILKPFAREADQWSGYPDNEPLVEGFGEYQGMLTVGHTREARSILSKALSSDDLTKEE